MSKYLVFLFIFALPAYSLDTKEKLIAMHNQGIISEPELKKKIVELNLEEPVATSDREIASTIQPIKVYRFTNPPLDIK